MTSPVAAPPPTPRVRRLWIPAAVVVLAAAALAVVWLPARDVDRMQRVVNSYMVTFVALLLLALWLVGLSGLRWWQRLAGLAAGFGLIVLAFNNANFDGDMLPVAPWKWRVFAGDPVARHRQQQGRAETPIDLTIKPTDWPGYFGPNRDGAAQGPELARDWKANPPKLVWRQPLGVGWGGFAVAGNAAITIEQRDSKEAVVAYEVATGREFWRHEYPEAFRRTEAMGGDGPRATPTIDGGDVFSYGATGKLVCLDGRSGQEKWSADTLQDNEVIYWGACSSPLVAGNLVIVNPGEQKDRRDGRAVVAYDRATGSKVWSGGNAKAGYASPVLATLAGRRQVLVFDAEGLASFDLADGRELWRYPWVTNPEVNAAQPLVLDDDRVFISSGYNHGCALLKVSESGGAWRAEEVWKKDNKPLRCKFASPVAHRGHFFGIDEGRTELVCIDQKDGQEKWRGGRYGHGQLLRCGELLVVLAETGELALVEANPEAFRELGRFPAIEGKTWNVPALAGGFVFVRNDHWMACYDLRAKKE
jgi:outer membrane protein assembly factor BamB